jgi:valyl-tRNA synthetase
MELPKRYDPKISEIKWQQFWLDHKTYKFNENNTTKPFYSIDTPPPTVSGKMHMGHAFMYTQMDFIARYKRMSGHEVFYPFGTDDNGLPTQILIQKLKKVHAQSMGRSEFTKLCIETLKNELRPKYLQDWKRIGMSCDWELFYSTINDHSRKISQNSFIELFEKGKAYRKNAPIMICPKCQTSIAQVELEDITEGSTLNYIKAKVEDDQYLIFATTRPELIPANVGLSLHEAGDYVRVHTQISGKDEVWILSVHAAEKFEEEWRLTNKSAPFKGSELVGKNVTIPIINKERQITHDEATKADFGTGFVYYCTYGGVDCIEWMQRHPDTESISIMNFTGRYNENAGKYEGMKSQKARAEILNDLENLHVLIKKESITHAVNVHERCSTAIEFVEETQWFIKLLENKEKWLELGEKINWFPHHMKNRYDNWAKGLKWDWNISRQIFFGVPFPVWYCEKCSEPIMAKKEDLPVDPTINAAPVTTCPTCGHDKIIGENDIMNTWATSCLSPQLAIELLDNNETKKQLYPMNLRPQGHDIISFWLFNTVAKAHLHYDSLPWHDAMITGWALDPKGKKMSKSKGNVIEPQVMIEKYSSDALRFWAAGSKLGSDLAFQEKDLLTGQKFVTKMWNASKFVLMHMENYEHDENYVITETFDKWLLTSLQKLIINCTENFDQYEYSKIKSDVEQFFWHTFCDQYLEIVKDRLYNPDVRSETAKKSAQFTLYTTLLAILKLMAPIMPYITEEIYQLFFAKNEGNSSIHVSTWPKAGNKHIDENAFGAGEFGVDIINTLRKYKSEKQLSMKEELNELILVTDTPKFEESVSAIIGDLKAVLHVKKISFQGETSLVTEKFKIKIGVI